jgi:hypothetical protein
MSRLDDEKIQRQQKRLSRATPAISEIRAVDPGNPCSHCSQWGGARPALSQTCTDERPTRHGDFVRCLVSCLSVRVCEEAVRDSRGNKSRNSAMNQKLGDAHFPMNRASKGYGLIAALASFPLFVRSRCAADECFFTECLALRPTFLPARLTSFAAAPTLPPTL